VRHRDEVAVEGPDESAVEAQVDVGAGGHKDVDVRLVEAPPLCVAEVHVAVDDRPRVYHKVEVHLR